MMPTVLPILPGYTPARGGRHLVCDVPPRMCAKTGKAQQASLAQLAEHALRKRMVVGSIPTGGLLAKCFNVGQWMADEFNPPRAHYLQEALGDGGRGEIVDHGFGVGFAPPPPTIHYLQTGAR